MFSATHRNKPMLLAQFTSRIIKSPLSSTCHHRHEAQQVTARPLDVSLHDIDMNAWHLTPRHAAIFYSTVTKTYRYKLSATSTVVIPSFHNYLMSSFSVHNAHGEHNAAELYSVLCFFMLCAAEAILFSLCPLSRCPSRCPVSTCIRPQGGRIHCTMQQRRNHITARGVNPLMGTLKPQSNGLLCSNTVIGTLAVDGWAVTFGTARRGLGGTAARPGPSSLYQM